MTIEIATLPEPENRTTKNVLGYVVPGEIATFSDFGSGERQTVSVYCFPDDSGGEVYSFANPGYAQVRDFRIVSLWDYLSQTPEAVITTGGNYERDITTEARQVGHVLFTHIPVSTN